MERTDLLNALRTVRDYCDHTNCEECKILLICQEEFASGSPCSWDLDDDV